LDRQEKEAVVAQLGEEMSEAESIFAIDYRGISVSQSAELRGALREADASFRVVKNRLTKLAAQKAGVAELEAMLEGPTALTFVRGDTAMAAKAITTFNREYEVLTYKGGLMGDMVLDEDRFKEIAKLPSRDALNAQLAGIVASPIVTLTRGLGSMIQGLAIALSQVAEQGLVGGSAETVAPAEEPSEDGAGEAPEEAADAGAEEAAGEPAAEEGSEETSEEAAEGSGGDGDGESDEASEPEAEAPAEEESAEEPAADEGEGQDAEETEADADSGGDDEGEGDQDDSPAEDDGEE
jgi:large subunit ribosomal protein L10